ncbi:MAG: hypothetical protein QOH87_4896 [Trebonia sp.]|nr:hypothetical protein [Trebonia sp.]
MLVRGAVLGSAWFFGCFVGIGARARGFVFCCDFLGSGGGGVTACRRVASAVGRGRRLRDAGPAG